MATAGFNIYISLVICFSLPQFALIEAANHGAGLTLNLIHRDSPLSPLHNPNHSKFDRLRNAFYRSIARVNRFKPNSVTVKALQTEMLPSGGEYYMRMFVGNPPVEALMIADTGADLTWVQCQPCQLCYKQKLPIFDPGHSSTYRTMHCGNRFCNAFDQKERTCAVGANTCQYNYSYGDGSFTSGNLGSETFTIGSSGSSSPGFPIVFGCSTRSGGIYDELGSGIAGLGGGTLSMVSQLGPMISSKFSYCLVPLSKSGSNTTSKIKFGAHSLVSGPGVVSTPMVSKPPGTFYSVTLEAVSVGEKRLAYNSSQNGNVGNVIVDSGTTLTYLNSKFFTEALEPVLVEAVKPAERVTDPQGIHNICFKGASGIDLPVITAHFTNADVKLLPENTFENEDAGLLCFTMLPSNDIGVLGNLAQTNFVVGFDLENKVVSFRPTDCTKDYQ